MVVYALINKKVIPYICDGKRVTTDYLHNKTKYKKDKLDKWLDVADIALPTIPQAKTLASCLHIPFASLYMNTEDIKIKAIPPIKNYRTFYGSSVVDDSGFNIAICDVLQERDFLIKESAELGIPLSSFSPPSCITEDPVKWAETIRQHFSIDIQEQYKTKSSRKFYLYLREKLERRGVFVQCFTDVPVENVRGFSIYEQSLPIIGLNDGDRPPAKSFSLIHELVHLMKRDLSVCNDMYNTATSQAEEVFCNAVAGELLVPRKELTALLDRLGYKSPYSIDDIRAVGNKFSVSKEVIIRRLFDCNYINKEEYEKYSNDFMQILAREREQQKLARKEGLERGFGRSVSREAIDRTSSVVCKALYYGYSEEIYSKRDIAQHLGIAQKHVDKFLMEVSRWSN